MNVIHENVLVEIPEIEKERGGILLPEGEAKKDYSGKVIRFGEAIPESVRYQLSHKPLVKYKEYYDGSEVTIEGKKYLVMNYKDILIIL